MARAYIIVLDSVGCGGAEDGAAYGDAGADTLGHLAAARARGAGDRNRLRSAPLTLPNLAALRLAEACAASPAVRPALPCHAGPPSGQW
ncbi:hypothetical protein WDZ92_48810, partial [Nostoc sp. NIES-2111]